MQVEQPSLVPGPPVVRFTSFSPARRPGAVTQPVHFANLALLDRRAGRMVRRVRLPWLETALFPAPAGNSPLS